ncbi:sulfurtransferase TusA family protein [Eubacterium sp. 1001713B170207_170306_E7]|uniref:sulfurtransferase TusA family protein n=1 Tax=Eubacterium sp. 1001713B170207_170306_E7 TaxID=2787097 RepID=UPI00189769AD|nr:sulfurtransferase TusA family protein [Eubacterium sp. 1001713B170207_170306_E7]
MKKIDCLGDICPLPLMKLQREVKAMQSGDRVMLVTDHSCAVKTIREYCEKTGLHCASDEVMNGVWEITVSR